MRIGHHATKMATRKLCIQKRFEFLDARMFFLSSFKFDGDLESLV